MENIAPQSNENLKSILKYCEILEKLDEIVNATEQIRRAHMQAGKELRNQLLNQMRGMDISELHTMGIQDFGGSENIPTTKRSFFVEAIILDAVKVSPQKINHPFTNI
jgi:pyruvate dehydrogenase complex dehydrogenase (E1) component